MNASWWVALFSAVVVLCLPYATDAKDHHHVEFRCGKTFVTFQAMQLRENGTRGLRMLYTVRKAHILQLQWVPPKGPPFVEMDQPRRPQPDVLVLNRIEDWSRLVECLD